MGGHDRPGDDGRLMALIIGTFFRFIARRLDTRPEDYDDAEVADGAGELGFFSPHSWWPLLIALSFHGRRGHRAVATLVDRRGHRLRPELRVRLRLRVLRQGPKSTDLAASPKVTIEALLAVPAMCRHSRCGPLVGFCQNKSELPAAAMRFRKRMAIR